MELYGDRSDLLVAYAPFIAGHRPLTTTGHGFFRPANDGYGGENTEKDSGKDEHHKAQAKTQSESRGEGEGHRETKGHCETKGERKTKGQRKTQR
jgi:hypothetical protein